MASRSSEEKYRVRGSVSNLSVSVSAGSYFHAERAANECFDLGADTAARRRPPSHRVQQNAAVSGASGNSA